ncbi:MAG: phosphate transport system permease protein [Spirochaetes bacterium]|nr:MAG: phosphate transport system permease protein [Spirochaetota bacterium]
MGAFDHDEGYRLRVRKNAAFTWLVLLPSLLVLAILAVIVLTVFLKGVKALNPRFFLETQKPFGDPGGGIANGIVGSVMVLGIAALVSVPLSILAALHLVEKSSSFLSTLLRLVVDSLQGIPSIVIGVVIYAWMVVSLGSFSAFSGGIALALIMIPTVTTSIQEVLLLVPASYMEAAISLGVPRWRASLGILLPAAKSGILNGVGLGIARISGETAPLLFTAFGNPFMNLNAAKPTGAIPLIIYEYIKSPYADWHEKAWGAALILVAFVFALNMAVGARKTDKSR